MATGPIERAFVDIVARLDTGDVESQLQDAMRRAVRRAEPALDRLERAGQDAARGVAQAFDRIDVRLNVRRALLSLDNMENAATAVVRNVRALDNLDVDIDARRAIQEVNELGDELEYLNARFRDLDGRELDVRAEELERDLRQVLIRVNDITRAIRGLDLEQVDIDTDPAIDELQRLGDFVSRALIDVERLDGQDVTVDVNTLGFRELDREINEAEDALRRLERIDVDIRPDVDTGELRRVGERAGFTVGDAFKRSLQFAVAGLFLDQLGEALAAIERFGFQSAASFETSLTSLTSLFSGFEDFENLTDPLDAAADAATRFADELRPIALRTPFEFEDIFEASQRLFLLSENTDLALERMNLLADAVALTGGNSRDLEGILKALDQMHAAGQLNLQDLQQIAQRLPILSREEVFSAIADQMGVTVERFQQLERSAVPAQAAINGIFVAMQGLPGVTGAAARQALTLQGALSNVRDFLFFEFAAAFEQVGSQAAQVLNDAIQSGGDLAEAVRPLIASFAELAEDVLPAALALIEELAPALTDAVQAVGPVVAQVARTLAPLLGGVLEGIVAFAEPLLDVIEDIAIELRPAFEAIGQLAGEVGGALGPAFAALAEGLVEVADPLSELVVAIVEALLPVMPDLTDLFVTFVEVGLLPMRFFLPIVAASLRLLARIIERISPLIDGLGAVLGFIADIAGAVADGIEAIGKALGAVVGFFVNAAQAATDFATAIPGVEAIGDALGAVGDGIGNLLSSGDDGSKLVAKLGEEAKVAADGVDGLVTEVISLADAIELLVAEVPNIAESLDLVALSAAGGGDFGRFFAAFVEGAASTEISAEQIEAAAVRIREALLTGLGDNFGGQLSREFVDAVSNLGGPQLQIIIDSLSERMEGFRAALDSVVPGIEDVQLAADDFSLQNFLDELSRIAEAQASVEGNMLELVQRFGTLGANVLDVLSRSGLSQDQFAVILEQALGGGEEVLRDILNRFGAVADTQIDELAEQLTAAGLGPEAIANLLNIEEFETGITRIEDAVNGIDLSPFEREIERLLGGDGPLSDLDEAALRRTEQARAAAIRRAASQQTPPTPPAIDVSGALRDAETAGAAVSEAFTASFDESLGIAEETAAAMEDAVAAAEDAADPFVSAAELVAARATARFEEALGVEEAVTVELALAGLQLVVGGGLPELGEALGARVGANFTLGLAAGIRSQTDVLRGAFDELVALFQQALARLALPTFSQPRTPATGPFATGFVATRPTFGLFGEAGPEALIPLEDGRSAARILRRLAPFIPSPGREAAEDIVGGGLVPTAGGDVFNNQFVVNVPTDDPELFARKAASRLANRLER